MKITVNKKIINEALSTLSGTVPKTSSIPALKGVLIKTKSETIEITAYDKEICMKTVIPAQIKEEGSIIIEAKTLSDHVQKAPSEIIDLSVNQNLQINFESGNMNSVMEGIASDEFPLLPNINGQEEFEMDSEILKSMIRQTIYAVAQAEAKPILQGCLFEINNNKIDVVGLDGNRLAIRRENVEVDEDTNFVVPAKPLQELLKINCSGNITIAPSRRHVIFKIENYTVISSVIEGEFIDYNAPIPTDYTAELTVKTKDFINSTDRVSIIIKDRINSPIRCSMNDGQVRLSCITSTGKIEDSFECEMSGEALEIGFNSKYLLDALKNTECDEIKIKISGPNKPMVICPLEGDSFTFLVLPCRLGRK